MFPNITLCHSTINGESIKAHVPLERISFDDPNDGDERFIKSEILRILLDGRKVNT
tara:strand:+ start:278 stop:445 length:168 start_codon:yes stop_codon:yes gene_type:complete